VRELAQGLNFPQSSPRPGTTGDTCAQASAYGMGMRVAVDCVAGFTLGHGGGYPGYGSYVLLLPDHGIGIFAFSNRTYSGPSGVVWDAAVELHRAGWLTGRTIPTSAALARAYRAAGAMYDAGDLGQDRALLAVNFLLDRSAENWAREFARLKGEAGACRTDAAIAATGALSGDFTWTCAQGTITGVLLLAPTDPPTIQALRLSVAPRR
jgi:hypothetical protein